MRWNTFTAITISLCVLGCERAQDAPVELGTAELTNLTSEPTQRSIQVPFGQPLAAIPAEDNVAVKAHETQYRKRLYSALAINKSAIVKGQWKDVDNQFRQILSEAHRAHPGPVYNSMIEQDAAATMFMNTALMYGVPHQGTISPDRQEAIAFYLELLLRNDFPDSRIILHALRRLDGFYSAKELDSLASHAASIAEGFASGPIAARLVARREPSVPSFRSETISEISITADSLRKEFASSY